MSVVDARINVWTSLDTESALERIAKQARDVDETCARMVKLAGQLKVRAQRGDRDAERALAVLVDESYGALAECMLEAV